jgi:hypothetical protein
MQTLFLNGTGVNLRDWHKTCKRKQQSESHFRLINAVVGFRQLLNAGIRYLSNGDKTSHEAKSKADVCETGQINWPVVFCLVDVGDRCKEQVKEAVYKGHVQAEYGNYGHEAKHFQRPQEAMENDMLVTPGQAVVKNFVAASEVISGQFLGQT